MKDKTLKVKAAETWGLLLYPGDRLKKYQGFLGADADCLVGACDSLIALTRVMQSAEWVFTDVELADGCRI